MNAAPIPDKSVVHQHCVDVIQKRIFDMERQIADLAESVANETKSTAGDKYETARAMLHIEQDQIRRQLAEARAQLATLNGIDPHKSCVTAGPGSLIFLENGWYYLSTSLGKATVGETQIFMISMQSPLAQKLRGLRIGNEILMNGKSLRVLDLR